MTTWAGWYVNNPRFIKEFHEDTGEYPPGELPEPDTRCDAEIESHIKSIMPIWKAWCAGRLRGLSDAQHVGQHLAEYQHFPKDWPIVGNDPTIKEEKL